MLISLALVAPGLLFLNYAIEKCSILWPNFQDQFWTQCNCFFPFCGPIFRPNFGPNFAVRLWHLPICFSYKVSNSTPKLDPKIGPQNGPKITSENLATNCIVSRKSGHKLDFFSAAPFKNKGCQAHQSKKSQHPTQHGILLILWNGWKDCWSISLQVIEKKALRRAKNANGVM